MQGVQGLQGLQAAQNLLGGPLTKELVEHRGEELADGRPERVRVGHLVAPPRIPGGARVGVRELQPVPVLGLDDAGVALAGAGGNELPVGDAAAVLAIRPGRRVGGGGLPYLRRGWITITLEI